MLGRVANREIAMSTKLFDLGGRRALVTGSGQGIGLALARGMADAGARVVLNGRDRAKLERAAEAIDGAEILPFDVTDHDAARTAIDGFEDDTGAIDILVNNAGNSSSGARCWRSFRPTRTSACCRPTSRRSSMSARPSRGT